MKASDTIAAVADKMTEAEYFAMSEERKVITPENIGGLADYPALFHAMQDNRELRPALTEAMSTGRAMNDFLSMSSEDFLKEYVVADGPVNPKTGKPYGTETKAYLEWRATQDKSPISTEQFNMFGKMATAYNEHVFIKSLNDLHYTRINNVILRADIEGVQCACKIDCLYATDMSTIAIDVKTTEDINAFGLAAGRLHYREQQALISVIMQALKIPVAQTRIAAIEKGPIPRCGIFGIERQNVWEHNVTEMLADYAKCVATGVFGTRFETPKLI